MATATLPTFAEYVNGDETTRLTFERAFPTEQNPIGGFEHRRVYDPWTPDVAQQERRMSLQLFRHGEWAHESDLERESCSACVLAGFVSESAREDGYRTEDGPNYAGWRRVYVQAGRTIPATWREAFVRDTDNEAYNDALGRDLVTFGHPGFSA